MHSTEASTSTTEALITVTGLLTAALVVVIMGWIVSCVYLQNRWVMDVHEVTLN